MTKPTREQVLDIEPIRITTGGVTYLAVTAEEWATIALALRLYAETMGREGEGDWYPLSDEERHGIKIALQVVKNVAESCYFGDLDPMPAFSAGGVAHTSAIKAILEGLLSGRHWDDVTMPVYAELERDRKSHESAPAPGYAEVLRTWNPIVGCSIVSPGCTNCYAMRMAARIEAMGTAPHYAGLTKDSKAGAVWTGEMAIAPERVLLEPLRRRKPTMWFVNSMGDLFHESVPDEWIDRVFAVMALTPQHTFQVLTKRSSRMRAYVGNIPNRDDLITDMALSIVGWPSGARSDRTRERRLTIMRALRARDNIWLGVSAEDQRRADERVPDLLATPAAVRFVSAEPLLGPIDFSAIPFTGGALQWVIVGGESGAGARVWPGFEEAARSIRDQCAEAGVAFFMKQMAGARKATMPPIPPDLMVRQFPLSGAPHHA